MPNNIGSGENTGQMEFAFPTSEITLKSQEVVAQQETPVLTEFTPEQLREHRQELLQKRKVFTQAVLDVIYEANKANIEIDPVEQGESEIIVERAQRLAAARFLKESVLDDTKLKAILETQLSHTDSSGKVHVKKIKALPYIKSILARLRVTPDRYISTIPKGQRSKKRILRKEILGSLKVFRKVYKENIWKNSPKTIYLSEVLSNVASADSIVKSSKEITDLQGFRDWLARNFSLEQISDKKSDEYKIFKTFLKGLRKEYTKKLVPARLNDKDFYQALLAGRYMPKALRYDLIDVKATDFNLCKFRDSLWGDYLETPDFFQKYKSYFFWIKQSEEGAKFQKNHLGTVWDMIPEEFREVWSQINLSYQDALDVNETFEKIDLKKKVRLEDGREVDFFEAYPSYFFWIKNSKEGEKFQENHLGAVWGMIPDEFRKVWSKIGLPYQDALDVNDAFKKIDLKKKVSLEDGSVVDFFEAYQSYFFWIKKSTEGEKFQKNHLGHVWGMIPDEFRKVWSKITLSYEDASNLNKAFEGIKLKDKSDVDRAQFFKDYPSYFFCLPKSH